MILNGEYSLGNRTEWEYVFTRKGESGKSPPQNTTILTSSVLQMCFCPIHQHLGRVHNTTQHMTNQQCTQHIITLQLQLILKHSAHMHNTAV